MKVLGIIMVILGILGALMGIITGSAFSAGIGGMIGYFGAAALLIYFGIKFTKK